MACDREERQRQTQLIGQLAVVSLERFQEGQRSVNLSLSVLISETSLDPVVVLENVLRMGL